jgi:branched-chain amino acid transport system substrate-binding protein
LHYGTAGLGACRLTTLGQALPKFRELAGDAANGMYYATHFSVATAQGIPAAQVFIEKFRAAYGKDPDFVGAESYDAATATFAAIAAAGKADRTAIRDARCARSRSTACAASSSSTPKAIRCLPHISFW